MNTMKFGMSLIAATCMLAGCQTYPVATTPAAQRAVAGDRSLTLRMIAPATRHVMAEVVRVQEGAIAHYRCRLALPSNDAYEDVATETVGTEGLVTFDHLKPASYRVFVEGIDENGEVITRPTFVDYTLDVATGSLNAATKEVQLQYKDTPFNGEIVLPHTYTTFNDQSFLPPWVTGLSFALKVDGITLQSGAYDPSKLNVIKNLKTGVHYDLEVTATGSALSWTDKKSLYWDPNEYYLSTTSPKETSGHPNGSAPTGKFVPNVFVGSNLKLAAAPDNSVWASGDDNGVGKLHHVSTTGSEATPYAYTGKAVALLADGSQGAWMLVSNEGQFVLHHVPVEGQATTTALGAVPTRVDNYMYIPVPYGGPGLDHGTLVSDGASGVWVGTFAGLSKVKADNTLDATASALAMSGLTHEEWETDVGVAEMVSNGEGGLWATDTTHVWNVGATGAVTLPKKANGDTITLLNNYAVQIRRGLAADGAGGLWIVGQNANNGASFGAFHLGKPGANGLTIASEVFPEIDEVFAAGPTEAYFNKAGYEGMARWTSTGGMGDFTVANRYTAMYFDGANGVWFQANNRFEHRTFGATTSDAIITADGGRDRDSTVAGTPSTLWMNEGYGSERIGLFPLDPQQ